MVEDFSRMEQSVLVDKLAEYTSRYMQFIMKGGVEHEMKDCKHKIEQIQKEIERRQTLRNSSPPEEFVRIDKRASQKNQRPG